MKMDKTVLAMLATTVLLVAFIGWAFYDTLKSVNGQGNIAESYPQKEVMIQAKAMQTARLDELAKKGKVVKGMDVEQVRLAKGEPMWIETIDLDSVSSEIIWWYQHEGWLSIIFNSKGSVSKIEFKTGAFGSSGDNWPMKTRLVDENGEHVKPVSWFTVPGKNSESKQQNLSGLLIFPKVPLLKFGLRHRFLRANSDGAYDSYTIKAP